MNGDGSYTSPPLTPSTAGTYHWVATYSGDANNTAVGPVGCTTPPETVTITKLTPGLTSSATPASAPVGTPIKDVATLTGGDAPTGTITWSLHGPNDNACTATPLTTSTVTVNGDNSYTSPTLTPTTAGTYHWAATYSGDTDNTAIGPVGCTDPNETVTITKLTPGLTTSATPASAPVGTPIKDITTLTGGDHPTGSITWRLYGPNESTCTNPAAPSVTLTNVNGDGAYTSPSLTPSTAGTYHWVATYSGDTDNTAVGPVGCTNASETVTITKLTPGLTSSATPASAPVGTTIKDVATLTGGDAPTGTITWSLHGPNDNACTATPLTTSTVTVNGDNSYTSPTLTPTTAGTYHWAATYSGDTDNTAIGPVGCTDPNETVTITKLTPGLTTSATPASAPVGTPIKDITTLTGGDHPTGSITWRLYGPNESTCTNPAAPSVTLTNVNGDGAYTSPALTPSTAGTYHWVATYSGDVNNTAVGPVGCTTPNETVTIGPAPPTVSKVQTQSVADTTAMIAFTINPNGADTTYVVKYSLDPLDPSLGTSTTPVDIGAGSTAQNVTATLMGLTPGSNYQYEVVATNATESISSSSSR